LGGVKGYIKKSIIINIDGAPKPGAIKKKKIILPPPPTERKKVGYCKGKHTKITC